ncbi:pyridoxamine 5'-phosphate oxidase family protein [Celeribacter sp.]|uniref:FAD-binding oxidoreductase n=1 Tax=Celeribacter sp. TaxID=1890673 RepID=UPI003A8D4EA3
MTVTSHNTPFHEGERTAQERAGVGDVAAWAGGFIRDYLPEQHRDFHRSLPFLVATGGDAAGQVWVTLLEGAEGFVTSPDPRQLHLRAHLGADDPLADAFVAGGDIGVLGIDLATRRRNRFSGTIRPDGPGYGISIRQSFGNCPQYISARAWTRVEAPRGAVAWSSALTKEQMARIRAADTMFIGSGYHGEAGGAANGYDASHRGGAAGFVHVTDATHLQIPDYAGNNYFNTIGNLVVDPRVGLLFIDFETGGLLHIAGRATIDWAPKDSHDRSARRMIHVDIEAVVDRSAAIALRWTKQDQTRRLTLTKRVRESRTITSFYFGPADGRPLDPFEAGQHLPIKVQIPGQIGTSKRSYSLSGPPDARGFYRITVKREDNGLVSRFLHDGLREGDVIEARAPAGDFVIPDVRSPLVLVSAGVGLTPMVPMLHVAASRGQRVYYVHGAHNGYDHAMHGEVTAMVRDNPLAVQHIVYSRPEDIDVWGRDYHAAGRMDADTVLGLNAGPQAQYMLCGPAAFIADMRCGLEARGVTPERIHVETFGPTG